MGDILTTGLTLSLVGMGIVFGLLALLWGLVAALLRADTPRVARAPSAAPTAHQSHEPARAAASETAAPPPDLVTAITIAVLSHRALQRRQAAPAIRSHQPGTLMHASRWVAAGRTRQNRTWPSQRG
jgi:sodium pump decarboxylase gamma subunit